MKRLRESRAAEGEIEVVGALDLNQIDVDADLGQSALDDDGRFLLPRCIQL